MKTYEKLGLPGRDDFMYWSAIYQRAGELGTDGCSNVSEIYREACLEHDIHYRTGRTLEGGFLTRAQADAVFRERIASLSPLDGFSPLSWVRWLGVRIFGREAWRGGWSRTHPKG